MTNLDFTLRTATVLLAAAFLLWLAPRIVEDGLWRTTAARWWASVYDRLDLQMRVDELLQKKEAAQGPLVDER